MLHKLFFSFAKVGAMSFGGGYAMLPVLKREIVERNKWASDEDIMDYYAVSQCLPGLIASNTAAFIGYKQKGVMGAAAAVLGVITPSVIIIMIAASLLKSIGDVQLVRHAFAGIRVAVAALIVSVTVKLWKSGVKGASSYVIFVLSLAIMLFTEISPMYIVLAAALYGLIRGMCEKKGRGKA